MLDVLMMKPIALCGLPQPAPARLWLSEIDMLAAAFCAVGLPMQPLGWQLLAGEAAAELGPLGARFEASSKALYVLQLPACRWAQARLFARGIGCLRESTLSPPPDDMRITRFPDASIITTREFSLGGVTYSAHSEVRTSVAACCFPVMEGAARWRSAADEQVARAFFAAGGTLHALAEFNGMAPPPVAPAAPVVNIENKVAALAGPVEMRIVSMPTRETASGIERNADGQITRSTQVERDAA